MDYSKNHSKNDGENSQMETQNTTYQAGCDFYHGLPVLIGVQDCALIGFTRSSFYRFMEREDIPVITISGRKYLYREKFLAWCDKQTETNNEQ